MVSSSGLRVKGPRLGPGFVGFKIEASGCTLDLQLGVKTPSNPPLK